MDGAEWRSAAQMAAAVRAGDVSARELVEAAITRIEEADPGLGAVSARMFERALERAEMASGPFAGVPMLLKDAGQELEGTPHWVGVAALRDAGARSSLTTPLAAAFERLGFVIVGKAAVPELSAGVTTEPPGFAPTRNPWNLGRTVGGSSGGSAAAVAAGLVPLAHGADGTGSLRFPASACGLVALCPTSGRIKAMPPAGLGDELGVWREYVLSRHTEDLAALFQVLVPDSNAVHPARLRIGLLDHDPLLGLALEPSCREGVLVVGEALAGLGHQVVEAWPSALAGLARRLAQPVGALVDAGRSAQVAWVSQRLGRPVVDGDLTDEVLAAAARGRNTSPALVDAAAMQVRGAVADLPSWWDDHDLLVTPTMRREPWPLGESAGPLHCGMFAAPFSFTGQPAISVPAWVSSDGLPVGVQLVAGRGGDELLLGVCGQLEEVLGWTRRRPPSGPVRPPVSRKIDR